MVAFNDVQAQLVGLKTKARFLGVHEVKKLAFLLEKGEKILICKKGWVNKKSTLLCVTDKQIAFVDVRSSKHVIGTIPFNEVTGVYRTNGRFTQAVRINTKNAFLYFVIWQDRHAKDIFLTIDRHIRYLQNNIISTRQVHSPKLNANLHTRHTLVRRVGYTSVAQ